MFRPTPRHIFYSALMLLILSGAATGYTLYKLYQGEQWVRHTYNVEVAIGNLQLTLNRAARDRLSFVNGNQASLADFESASKTSYQYLADLRVLLGDNAEQRDRCDQFRAAMDSRLNVLQQSIDAVQSDKSTDALQDKFTDQSLKENFRTAAISDQMKNVEETLLTQRDQITVKLFQRMVIAIVFSFILAIYLIWEHYRRINTELRQRTQAEQQAQLLSAQVLLAQDEERRRISRELHDGLGQSMVAAKMMADSLAAESPEDPNTVELAGILADALSGVRTMSYLLYPPMLDEIGLASAAEWFIEGYSKRTGITVQCGIGGQKRRLQPVAELTLFRVLQESLTNIQRHAQSPNAEVQLDFGRDRVSMRVRDHGVGMSPEMLIRLQTDGVQLGVGLAGMRQRVKEQNGTFKLSSDSGGTVISVQLPVTN
jgi:signal transduction histidine kinase